MKPNLHITGASGSGTTTLGRALSERFGYVALDADDYFWLPTDPPFTQKRDRAKRLVSLLADRDKNLPSVVCGSIVGWGAELEQSFDLVIFLLIPPAIGLARLEEREIRLRGRATREFMEWAALYDTGDISVRSRALHEKWLSEIECPILRLEGDLSVEERVALVDKALQGAG